MDVLSIVGSCDERKQVVMDLLPVLVKVQGPNTHNLVLSAFEIALHNLVNSRIEKDCMTSVIQGVVKQIVQVGTDLVKVIRPEFLCSEVFLKQIRGIFAFHDHFPVIRDEADVGLHFWE